MYRNTENIAQITHFVLFRTAVIVCMCYVILLKNDNNWYRFWKWSIIFYLLAMSNVTHCHACATKTCSKMLSCFKWWVGLECDIAWNVDNRQFETESFTDLNWMICWSKRPFAYVDSLNTILLFIFVSTSIEYVVRNSIFLNENLNLQKLTCDS